VTAPGTRAGHPARLREQLSALLQEPDEHRPLDSLEVVVVHAYLNRHGIATEVPGEERPRTIEGWVTWAVRHSRDS
jgi:hypothetical protein